MTEVTNNQKPVKKERAGRWTKAECSTFEELLERYGKNWRKIQEHMKGRSLSQIRSHAQKFFEKAGPKKVSEYERKANLLLAYETLEKEKRLQEESQHENFTQNLKFIENLVKDKEECPSFSHNDDQTIMTELQQTKQIKQSEIIKEQAIQTPIIKEEPLNNSFIQPIPTMYTIPPHNMGYLMYLMQCYPDYFANLGLTQISQPQHKGFRAYNFNASTQ